MAEIANVNGAGTDSITKVDGVAKASITKLSGATMGSGLQAASKWLVGAGNGQIWRSTIANAGYGDQTNAGNWSKIADLGTSQSKAIAFGQDNAGNKRWAVHMVNPSEEIAYVNDGNEVSSPTTSQGNWVSVNLSNDHTSGNGGPSLAYGNNLWMGVGDDIGDDPEDVLFASSDGGGTWATVSTAAQQTNDVGRVICYKGTGNTWIFTVQDFIYRATTSPTVGSNWSEVKELAWDGAQDITAMAFNGTIWLCVDISGHAFTSVDDWSNVDTNGPNGAQINASLAPFGLCYCAGTVNKWVVVGNNGHIWLSPDAVNWTQATTPGTSDLRCVATDNITIVAVGTGGAAYVSQDGTTWRDTAQNCSVGTAFWSVSPDLIGTGMR